MSSNNYLKDTFKRLYRRFQNFQVSLGVTSVAILFYLFIFVSCLYIEKKVYRFVLYNYSYTFLFDFIKRTVHIRVKSTQLLELLKSIVMVHQYKI